MITGILAHYLYHGSGSEELNFSSLAGFIDCVPPEVKDDVYRILSQRSAELVEHYVVTNKPEALSDLFTKLEKVCFVLTDKVLGQQINAIAQRLVKNYQLDSLLKLRNALVMHKQELVNELDALVLRNIKGLLSTCLIERHGDSLATIKQLIIDCDGIDEKAKAAVFAKLASEMLSCGQVLAYLRLKRFAKLFRVEVANPGVAHRRKFKIDAQMRATSVGGKTLFSRTPKDSHIQAFTALKKLALAGNCYASFELAQLYFSGRAIIESDISPDSVRGENGKFANLYSLIAFYQAGLLGAAIQKQVKTWRDKQGYRQTSLVHSYFNKLNKAISSQSKQDDLINIIVFIATHVDYSTFIDSKIQSQAKQCFERERAKILTRSDLTYAANLVDIYKALTDNGVKVLSDGGSAYPDDPKLRLKEVYFHYELQKLIAHLSEYDDRAVDFKTVFEGFQRAMKLNSEQTIALLQRVYNHMTIEPLPQQVPGSFNQQKHILLTVIDKCGLNLHLSTPVSDDNEGSIVSKVKQLLSQFVDKSIKAEQVVNGLIEGNHLTYQHACDWIFTSYLSCQPSSSSASGHDKQEKPVFSPSLLPDYINTICRINGIELEVPCVPHDVIPTKQGGDISAFFTPIRDSMADPVLPEAMSKSELVVNAIKAISENKAYQVEMVLVSLQSNYAIDEVTARQWVAEAYLNSIPLGLIAASSTGFFVAPEVGIEHQLQAITRYKGLTDYVLWQPGAACSSIYA